MKSLFTLLAILGLGFNASAQEYEYEYESGSEEVVEEVSVNCFEKYAKLYEERGAEEVEDGTYEDVVIIVDKGGVKDCFSGKANVFNKKLVCSSVQFATDGGEYREGPKTRAIPVFIQNGMSKPYQAGESQVIVIFPKALKPKADGIKKAPDPID